MPIIKGQTEDKKINIKAKLKTSIADEIEQYCKWANVPDTAAFLEGAAEHILATDKDWKKYKKSAQPEGV